MKDAVIFGLLLFGTVIVIIIGMFILLNHLFSFFHIKIQSGFREGGINIKNKAIIRRAVTLSLFISTVLCLSFAALKLFPDKTSLYKNIQHKLSEDGLPGAGQEQNKDSDEYSKGQIARSDISGVYILYKGQGALSQIYAPDEYVSTVGDQETELSPEEVSSFDDQVKTYAGRLDARIILLIDMTDGKYNGARDKLQNKLNDNSVGDVYKKEKEIVLYINTQNNDLVTFSSGFIKNDRLERYLILGTDKTESPALNIRKLLNALRDFSKHPYIYTFTYVFSIPWLIFSLISAFLFATILTSLLIAPKEESFQRLKTNDNRADNERADDNRASNKNQWSRFKNKHGRSNNAAGQSAIRQSTVKQNSARHNVVKHNVSSRNVNKNSRVKRDVIKQDAVKHDPIAHKVVQNQSSTTSQPYGQAQNITSRQALHKTQGVKPNGTKKAPPIGSQDKKNKNRTTKHSEIQPCMKKK